MSGVVRGIKKRFKKAVRFVKRHWKKIVIAALIVFTAGIATVGLAGFSAAATYAGGGIGGALSAVGSTFAAGAASIGGAVGIGQGVTASTAGGAFAAAPAVQGAIGASGGAMGATLGTGAAAQAVGLAPQAAQWAAGAGAGGVGPNAMMAASTSSAAGNVAGSVGGAALNNASNASQTGGLMSSMSNSPWTGPLLNAGIQGIGAYMQARAAEQAAEAQEPLSFYGVALKDRDKNPSLTPDQMFPGAVAESNIASWRRPGKGMMPGLMGGSSYGYTPQPAGPNALAQNPALAYDMQENPNANNWLSEEADPTARNMRGMA